MRIHPAINILFTLKCLRTSDLNKLFLSRFLWTSIFLALSMSWQKCLAGDWDTSLNLTSKLVNAPIFNTQMRLYFANENNQTLPSLTLIHGVGGSAQDFADLVPLLANNYKLILVDLPGYGDSAQSKELYSSSNYAKNLAIVLPGVANQSNSIVGHSMGGNVALQLVEMAPHLAKKLILIDAAGMLHKFSYSKYVALNKVSKVPFLSKKHQNKLGGWIDKINQFVPDFTDILLSGPSRAHVLNDNSTYISAISVMHENLTNTLRNINTPSLIIWGQADPVMPYHTGVMLNYLLADSQFELIPNVGHSPQKESSEEVYQMMFRFLRKEISAPSQQQKMTMPQSELHYVLDCNNGDIRQLNNLHYKRITISNCANLEIDRISTEQITVLNSTLVLNHLAIKNPNDTAITSVKSKVTIWGGEIVALTAMELITSNVDLNGVDITTGDTAYITDIHSQILASVSLLKQGITEQHWHGFIKN